MIRFCVISENKYPTSVSAHGELSYVPLNVEVETSQTIFDALSEHLKGMPDYRIVVTNGESPLEA